MGVQKNHDNFPNSGCLLLHTRLENALPEKYDLSHLASYNFPSTASP